MVNSYRLLSDMAPHGKEMTTEQKEIVLQMSNAGFSSYKIQDVNVNFLNVCAKGEVWKIYHEVEEKEKRQFAMTGASCGASKRTGDRL